MKNVINIQKKDIVTFLYGDQFKIIDLILTRFYEARKSYLMNFDIYFKCDAMNISLKVIPIADWIESFRDSLIVYEKTICTEEDLSLSCIIGGNTIEFESYYLDEEKNKNNFDYVSLDIKNHVFVYKDEFGDEVLNENSLTDFLYKFHYLYPGIEIPEFTWVVEKIK